MKAIFREIVCVISLTLTTALIQMLFAIILRTDTGFYVLISRTESPQVAPADLGGGAVGGGDANAPPTANASPTRHVIHSPWPAAVDDDTAVAAAAAAGRSAVGPSPQSLELLPAPTSFLDDSPAVEVPSATLGRDSMDPPGLDLPSPSVIDPGSRSMPGVGSQPGPQSAPQSVPQSAPSEGAVRRSPPLIGAQLQPQLLKRRRQRLPVSELQPPELLLHPFFSSHARGGERTASIIPPDGSMRARFAEPSDAASDDDDLWGAADLHLYFEVARRMAARLQREAQQLQQVNTLLDDVLFRPQTTKWVVKS